MQQQEAYDLETFSNRPESTYNRIRLEKGGQPSQSRLNKLRRFKTFAACMLLLTLACALLQSQAKLNELNMNVQYTQSELESAKSEYDYLSSVLSSKTNLKTVEEVAASELGLMKRDESQVTYITLEKESMISSPQSSTEKLLSFLRCRGEDLLQALNP